jgi:hypothetical protein
MSLVDIEITRTNEQRDTRDAAPIARIVNRRLAGGHGPHVPAAGMGRAVPTKARALG